MTVAESNVEVIRRAYDEFFARGELPFDSCDPAIVIENVADSPIPGPYHGHEGLQRWWDEIGGLGPRLLRLEADEVIALGDDRVLATLRFAGRSVAGFDLSAFPWAAVHWLRDGRVVRVRGYMSREDALRTAEPH